MVKLMLEQNAENVKSYVQCMFDDMKKEMHSLRVENMELKRSLEFTQSEFDEFRKNSERGNSVKLEDLSDRMRNMEDNKRKKNLKITGLEELPNENTEQTQVKVEKLIKENLKLDHPKVISAYRAGPRQFDTTRPRPIIAKLENVEHKILCFKSSNKLKGSNVYIDEDVCKATQDIRRSKLDELKKKRSEGFIAYFSGVNIVTKKRNLLHEANERPMHV